MRALVLAVALLAAACGDDDPITPRPDAATVPDARSADAPPAAATFADQVKDLIVNKTSESLEPVAVDFDSADSEDPGTYGSLF